ncbi:unnamed protein product [Tilletia controversa]|nr:unnamed protein product [Tilletia controversa]
MTDACDESGSLPAGAERSLRAVNVAAAEEIEDEDTERSGLLLVSAAATTVVDAGDDLVALMRGDAKECR